MAEGIENSRDGRDAEIILAVAKYIKDNEISGITAIGPVSVDGCKVQLFSVNILEAKLPSSFRIMVGREDTSVELDPVKDPAPTRLYFGPNPKPPQHSGPMMGGDPVWNNDASEAGTLTFFCDQASQVLINGYPCSNRGLSARHVMYDNSGAWGAILSTTRYANSMARAWKSSPSSTVWYDVAGADILGNVPTIPLAVRGLGQIAGVRQPAIGDRVSKYSWQTGLTSGVDLGLVAVALDSTQPYVYFLLRRVSGRFAREGDSGSAILDRNRNLVGIVTAGKDAIDQTYYTQALPDGETPAHALLSVFTVKNL